MPITDAERERAARALCRKAGYPEDINFDGQPAWAWYLDQVDTVLDAALSADEFGAPGEADRDDGFGPDDSPREKRK